MEWRRSSKGFDGRRKTPERGRETEILEGENLLTHFEGWFCPALNSLMLGAWSKSLQVSKQEGNQFCPMSSKLLYYSSVLGRGNPGGNESGWHLWSKDCCGGSKSRTPMFLLHPPVLSSVSSPPPPLPPPRAFHSVLCLCIGRFSASLPTDWVVPMSITTNLGISTSTPPSLCPLQPRFVLFCIYELELPPRSPSVPSTSLMCAP